MQIILSRKGFDSKNGGMPSPILPDGTLLSLPIPSKKDSVKYSDLFFMNKSYFEIIKELKPKTKIKNDYSCHLDPDIRKNVKKRNKNWMPLFGQQGAALSHLEKNGVCEGDIFLFFGRFRKTEEVNNRLKFDSKTGDLHVIFGYFQVGKKYYVSDYLPKRFMYHPHSVKSNYRKDNCIYKSADKLNIIPELPGAGVFKFNNKLVLTKEGESRSKWNLPLFFKEVEISYHTKKSWKKDYFQSAAIGQEFVIKANIKIIDWAKDIIKTGLN